MCKCVLRIKTHGAQTEQVTAPLSQSVLRSDSASLAQSSDAFAHGVHVKMGARRRAEQRGGVCHHKQISKTTQKVSNSDTNCTALGDPFLSLSMLSLTIWSSAKHVLYASYHQPHVHQRHADPSINTQSHVSNMSHDSKHTKAADLTLTMLMSHTLAASRMSTSHMGLNCRLCTTVLSPQSCCACSCAVRIGSLTQRL